MITIVNGQILGRRYRIERFIDRGGMADVYLARDLQRNIPVALKFMRSDFADDYQFERRFRKEAAALDRLNHPNIVQFYELVRADDHLFMVMAYVNGITLRKYMARLKREARRELARLPAAQALYVMQRLASALDYAHQTGVLHRDLKPGNVMLDRAGNIFLADFGIAKLSDSATITTVHAGTPAYMSPEQCLGNVLNKQSDLYSFGVLAYELLSGRRPFIGNSSQGEAASLGESLRLEHIRSVPPDIRQFNNELSMSVAATFGKMLAKQPEQRYGSARVFVQRLEAALPRPQAMYAYASQAAKTPTPAIQKFAPQPNGNRERSVWLQLWLGVMTVVFIGVGVFGVLRVSPRTTGGVVSATNTPAEEQRTSSPTSVSTLPEKSARVEETATTSQILNPTNEPEQKTDLISSTEVQTLTLVPTLIETTATPTAATAVVTVPPTATFTANPPTPIPATSTFTAQPPTPIPSTSTPTVVPTPVSSWSITSLNVSFSHTDAPNGFGGRIQSKGCGAVINVMPESTVVTGGVLTFIDAGSGQTAFELPVNVDPNYGFISVSIPNSVSGQYRFSARLSSADGAFQTTTFNTVAFAKHEAFTKPGYYDSSYAQGSTIQFFGDGSCAAQ